MNKTFFSGRLTKDVEYNEEKRYSKFTLALNEKIGDETVPQFINHIAFGNMAELVKKYLKKGSKVLVEGKFSQNQSKREQISFIVEKIEFLENKDKSQDQDKNFPF